MVEALREISIPVSSEKTATGQSTTTSSQAQEKQTAPLFTLPSPTSATESGSDITLPSPALPASRSESRASTYASEDFSAPSSRHEGSEAGMETEEDEGMVLVDRPAS